MAWRIIRVVALVAAVISALLAVYRFGQGDTGAGIREVVYAFLGVALAVLAPRGGAWAERRSARYHERQ